MSSSQKLQVLVVEDDDETLKQLETFHQPSNKTD